jgi:uroporphyrinogen-III decarboxylase
MTHTQRFLNALNRQPVDRLAYGDGLWGETSAKYIAEGKLKEGEDVCAPFEQMHPVCGHEYMLMGMALDPDWVKDMVNTYAKMTLMHMDMPRIAKAFGNRISFCGNIDIRIVSTGDRAAIDAELNRKIIPVLKMGSGFIRHSDHSIPPTVEHDTLAWFFEHGSRITERM